MDHGSICLEMPLDNCVSSDWTTVLLRHRFACESLAASRSHASTLVGFKETRRYILTMAEKVINNSVSCDSLVNRNQHNSVNKFTFVNLKDKRCVLQSVDNVNGGAINSVAGTAVACSTSEVATSKTVTIAPAPVKRFANATLENIYDMKERRFEEKTLKNTKWGVKIFGDWLVENNLDREFAILSPSELDILLAKFYLDVRKVDGQYYSKTSYTCIRAAVQRYLQNPPWNVKYCILKDSAFLHSNQVLKGVFKHLTAIGATNINHFKAIEREDMVKLRNSEVLGTENPRALQNLVWLSVALQFGKRGGESYRSMTKSTFRRGTDDSGSVFYEYAVCESQKNHSGGNLSTTHKPQGRITLVQVTDCVLYQPWTNI